MASYVAAASGSAAMHADAGTTVPESIMNCVVVSSVSTMSGSDAGSARRSSYFLSSSS